MGGARFAAKLMADIERIFGVRGGNIYGMGENLMHTHTLPADAPKIIRQTVGTLVPGVEYVRKTLQQELADCW